MLGELLWQAEGDKDNDDEYGKVGDIPDDDDEYAVGVDGVGDWS